MRKEKLHRLYHRILLALSLSDIGLSICNVLQIFLTKQYPFAGNLWAMGTVASCHGLATVFSFFALCGPIYNCLLALYFYCSICHNMKDSKLSVWLERPIHAIAIVLSTALPLLGYLQKGTVFHFFAMICVPGKGRGFIALAPGILIGSTAVICVVATLATLRYVRYQIAATQRYTQHSSCRRRQNTQREASIQSVYYCLAFMNSFAWAVTITVMGLTVQPLEAIRGYFVLKLLMMTCYPLQGALNAGIYLRPYAVQWKRVCPDRSWCWAWGQAARGRAPTSLPVVMVREKKTKNTMVRTGTAATVKGKVLSAGAQELAPSSSSLEGDDDKDTECGNSSGHGEVDVSSLDEDVSSSTIGPRVDDTTAIRYEIHDDDGDCEDSV